jgi:Protein of unknown function (DUF2723)
LTPRQTRTLVIAISLLVAATRLLAAAHSLWEWDETLFCLSLRGFNVAAHHPHPPGFPLYVALGRLFRLFADTDFHALRAVNLLSAMLVFPATYALARAMTLEVMPSIAAGLLTSFFPNVWFYGGTAFSDEPTLALLLFGCALLLRGRTSRCAYFAGCVVMAAACVMRPQNVLIGAYPWLAGSWRRPRREAIAGLAIMAAIIAAFFGAAAYLTGFEAYRTATRLHGEYVLRVDSYHNPARPHWFRTLPQFLLDPYNAGRISAIVAALAAVGVLRFRRPAIESLLTFGPFLVFAMFMLNVETGGRYAITLMPMLAICAAEGTRLIADAVERRASSPVVSISIQIIIVLLICTRLTRWTLPALAEVRKHDSPPVEAARWVHRHLDRNTTTLYIHGSMGPWSEYLLGDYKRVDAGDDFSGVSLADTRNAWLFAEGLSSARGAVNFTRPHGGHLFDISRKRYFEVSVRPLASDIAFVDGWYAEESGGGTAWRWMGSHATARLPALHGGKGELALTFNVPLDAEPRKPVVTIAINGTVVDRFAADAHAEKRWIVPAAASGPNVLMIDVDEAVSPPHDGRHLGLQLMAWSWQEAP